MNVMFKDFTIYLFITGCICWHLYLKIYANESVYFIRDTPEHRNQSDWIVKVDDSFPYFTYQQCVLLLLLFPHFSPPSILKIQSDSTSSGRYPHKPVLISQTMLPSSYSEKCYDHLHPKEDIRKVHGCMCDTSTRDGICNTRERACKGIYGS